MPQDREREGSTTSAGLDGSEKTTAETDNTTTSDLLGEDSNIKPVVKKSDGNEGSTTSAGLE